MWLTPLTMARATVIQPLWSPPTLHCSATRCCHPATGTLLQGCLCSIDFPLHAFCRAPASSRHPAALPTLPWPLPTQVTLSSFSSSAGHWWGGVLADTNSLMCPRQGQPSSWAAWNAGIHQMFALDAVVLFLGRAWWVLLEQALRLGQPCQGNGAHCWELCLLCKQKGPLALICGPVEMRRKVAWPRSWGKLEQGQEESSHFQAPGIWLPLRVLSMGLHRCLWAAKWNV